MMIARTRGELRELTGSGDGIAFVPTMGALHEGHLSLVRAAAEVGGPIVLSIFVNPLQFGSTEDLASYPRDEDRDLSLAGAAGVDVAFVPAAEEIYPSGGSVTVDAGPLGRILEGAARPGHFHGVATVVAKLFNLVRPRYAFFGQKDAQQVAVVRGMVRDLLFQTEIVVGPIVRDVDGLALSSRNAYLTEEGRRRALALWSSLRAGEKAWRAGGSPQEAETAMHEVLAVAEGVEPDYAVAVDPDSFVAPPEGTDEVLLLVAARVGTTRLIDNLQVTRDRD